MKTLFLVFVFCSLTFFFGWLLAKWDCTQAQLARCEHCAFAQFVSPAVSDISTTFIPDDGSMPIPILMGETHKPTKATVDLDGLILTESGGNCRAVGDNGASKGLCQIQKAAWQETCEWLKVSIPYTEENCFNAATNRRVADGYINRVIPEKYLHRWNAFDSVDTRISCYKRGPGRWYQGYRDYGEHWREYLPDRVQRDLAKYHEFVNVKKVKNKV